ncbi:MAG TPA: dTDP-4-dehydrorhamnose reductase [Myxococcota bacterium]|nr:dTDP-4-dehydrorhamnose reductase [Myxococcota bacterium]
MRWLLSGASGQLGRSMVCALAASPRHTLTAALDRGALDLGDRASIARTVRGAQGRADVFLNAAAFTFVDRCESERELARRVNGDGPRNLARACNDAGLLLVHISTDYVFDGKATRPYTETDQPAPASVYGHTKLEGEQAVLAESAAFLVVRTSWVFGPGRNFVRTMIEQAGARRARRDPSSLRVVDDQFGSPTYAGDLAAGIMSLVEVGAGGLYHLANRGVATWWDVARECLDQGGFQDVAIERVRTSEFPRPAPRPAYSALDCTKAERIGVRLPGWRDAVGAYLRSDASPLAAAPGGSA